jgi:hypothetical protein
LEAAARCSPVDLNLPTLLDESASNLSGRLRLWHTLAEYFLRTLCKRHLHKWKATTIAAVPRRK